jgi:hypothetical protein
MDVERSGQGGYSSTRPVPRICERSTRRGPTDRPRWEPPTTSMAGSPTAVLGARPAHFLGSVLHQHYPPVASRGGCSAIRAGLIAGGNGRADEKRPSYGQPTVKRSWGAWWDSAALRADADVRHPSGACPRVGDNAGYGWVSPAVIRHTKIILSAVFTTALNHFVVALHPCRGRQDTAVSVKEYQDQPVSSSASESQSGGGAAN